MTDQPPAALHPDVAVFAPLLGTWSGTGRGDYPTIEAFDYLETITFGHVGKPFVAYGQRTADPTDRRPLHAETGYLRSTGRGDAEFVVAHPTGLTELAEGTVESTEHGLRLVLRSLQVIGTSSSKSVTAIERSLIVDGDGLRYTLAMAAVGEPMTHHLSAELRMESL